MDWKCCLASTSVGASITAWPPASTTASIARSATSVLPEPTSPCSSRCIGEEPASSSKMVSPMLTWPLVSSKGSRASKASSSPPTRRGRGVASRAAFSRRRRTMASWMPNASSNFSRRMPSSACARSVGSWTAVSACSNGSTPASRTTHSGRVSPAMAGSAI